MTSAVTKITAAATPANTAAASPKAAIHAHGPAIYG